MAEGEDTEKAGFDFGTRPNHWLGDIRNALYQRALPLAQPRLPNMEYADMTVEADHEEGGIELSSFEKDRFRRSEAQVKAIKAARKDQRSVAGGVWQCERQDLRNFFVTIERPYMAAKLGVKLVKLDEVTNKPQTVFHSFFLMKYEKIVGISGLRYTNMFQAFCKMMRETRKYHSYFGLKMIVNNYKMKRKLIVAFLGPKGSGLHPLKLQSFANPPPDTTLHFSPKYEV